MRAIFLNRLVHLQCSRRHGAKRAERIQRHCDANRGQFISLEQGGLAKLGQVGEYRNFDHIRKLPILVERRQRFGENHIRAGFDVRGSAIDRRLLTLDRMRVGPRHDDESIIDAPVDRRLQSICHFIRGDQRLAGSMPTTFDGDLVFKMTAGGTGPGHFSHSASDHEGATPAGVGIDE